MSAVASSRIGLTLAPAERLPHRSAGRLVRDWVRRIVPPSVMRLVGPSPPAWSLHAALWRARHRGIVVRSVIDVGASDAFDDGA